MLREPINSTTDNITDSITDAVKQFTVNGTYQIGHLVGTHRWVESWSLSTKSILPSRFDKRNSAGSTSLVLAK